MTPSRRSLFGAAACGVVVATTGMTRAGLRDVSGPALATVLPVAHTTHGAVQGITRGGVHSFKGIPYADAPVGNHRFLRAPPLTRWEGRRNAFNYGPICPQSAVSQDEAQSEWSFLIQKGPVTAQSEDCLRINIWTRGLGDGGKRPVMLWLHPNGFMSGSGHEYLASDGANLAATEDVVVASINHRVGVLGHLHLVDLGGTKYEDSGNVGMLDIIDVLTWLGENAEAFGGNPGNITVFGQSGGGSKTTVLLAMPQARGLFHKAISQSGFGLKVHTPTSASALARATSHSLGSGNGNLSALQAMPFSRLVEASLDAWYAVRRDDPDNPPAAYWQPVSGVPSLPSQPFVPAAPETASNIPMLVTTVRNESSPSIDAPETENISWEEVAARLKPQIGEQAGAAVDATRRVYPSAKPVEALSIIQGRTFELAAQDLSGRKAVQVRAAVYKGIFAWETPVFERRPRAFHTSDVPFVFNNTDLCDQATGGGEDARQLAARMSSAWARFARTGNPNGAGLPFWAPFDQVRQSTMIFDDDCRLIDDTREELNQVFRLLSS